MERYAKATVFVRPEFDERVNDLDFVLGEFNNLIKFYSKEDQKKFHSVQLLVMDIISNNLVFLDGE